MIQIISRNGVVICTNTGRPYPADIIKAMKQSGYKVKEIKDEKGLEI